MHIQVQKCYNIINWTCPCERMTHICVNLHVTIVSYVAVLLLPWTLTRNLPSGARINEFHTWHHGSFRDTYLIVLSFTGLFLNQWLHSTMCLSLTKLPSCLFTEPCSNILLTISVFSLTFPWSAIRAVGWPCVSMFVLTKVMGIGAKRQYVVDNVCEITHFSQLIFANLANNVALSPC